MDGGHEYDALEVGLAVAEAGAAAVLYTDIGRDGMRSGPNLEATARLAAKIAPCAVIASAGWRAWRTSIR